jgi:GNAT superfamily N-acetyltransferase
MKDNYRVRPAQLADADGLCRILESLGRFPHLDGSGQSRAGIIRQIALCLADSSHYLLVAQQAGAGLVGYVSLHRNPSLFLTSPEVYLAELFVHPEARKHGVGTALLEEAEHWAQREGCSRMLLINNRLRQSYLDEFYAKRGWREREDMANFVLPLHRPGESD